MIDAVSVRDAATVVLLDLEMVALALGSVEADSVLDALWVEVIDGVAVTNTGADSDTVGVSLAVGLGVADAGLDALLPVATALTDAVSLAVSNNEADTDPIGLAE